MQKVIALAATAAFVQAQYPAHSTSCICALSCKATGCAGCCSGTPQYWNQAWSRASYGLGLSTEGHPMVLSSTPTYSYTSHAPKRFCHVHEGDKTSSIKTTKMVKKDFVTYKTEMVPRTRKVMKTVMKAHK